MLWILGFFEDPNTKKLTDVVYKTSDPQTILGSFNGQLQDDIMEIHEKYKTPTHYKNFISTIVLTNENALRVENDDRRTVLLDVSPSCKGDLNYFKKLGDTMKYPGASEAFYAYLRAIADAYPDFNGNPPPMTTSKQDHIISTLPPLFQFIKDTYLIVKNHMTDLPVQEFYRYIQEDLYKKFLGKNWIHETDEIDIEGIDIDTPEKLASDPNALEKFLANIYNPASKSQVDQEKVELVVEKPAEEKPAPVIKEQSVAKKASPPVPPKPDCLKVKPASVIKEDSVLEEPPAPVEKQDEFIDSFSDCYLSDEEPDQEDEPSAEEPVPEADDDYDVLGDLLSDSDPITTNPAHEQQPESAAEDSASVTKPDPEPVVKPASEQPIPELNTELEVDRNPEPREGKELWAKYQDTSDEYDWDMLVFEVEECPITRVEDKYQYYLREVVNRFKDWIEYNGNLPKTPSCKELANIIRAYKEDHDAEIIPTPSGYETMKMNKGKAREIPEERPKTEMERQWEAANDGFILLPYENWKPGRWTSGNQPASLFSLLDHYDVAQLPDNADPDYFERFIIYVRGAPPVAGGCNGELNDCLYECLKHIYSIFSKIPETIKKPEYIKKALGLNRDASVPVSNMDKVEQLAGSLTLNIVGDSTRISKSKSNRRATLILSEGHYSLALNPGRLHPSKLDRKQKSPFVYREDGVNNVVTIYNGKTVKSLTVGQFQNGKNSDSYSFIPIEKNRKTGIYETLEETYQRIHEERDSFLQATKKFSLGIDLSYHNWSYKRTALWLFERFSVGVPANDPLDPIEADIQQLNVNFPIRQGKFQILKDFVDYRGYALYGLFRAKLIQDGKPNALIYDREARIPGTVIFGEYVHFLFNIKNQGGVAGHVAKRVLNTLWGALCQRKRNYKTLTTNQTDPFKFPEGHTLDSIIPVESDQWRFQLTNPGSPFKGEYPRIAPFLLAHERKMISELLEPYK
ncbi:uncharacterized protein OCT59_009413 [Rhizophagus irregularis]|uniref:uncharacterized protein n=1 Tax=Rhizophagus irregularis TaxID=588596 RepID=UPI00331D6A4C|nr:hypothetical protein OCT59_009413 [Rhizophagus irregularis]